MYCINFCIFILPRRQIKIYLSIYLSLTWPPLQPQSSVYNTTPQARRATFSRPLICISAGEAYIRSKSADSRKSRLPAFSSAARNLENFPRYRVSCALFAFIFASRLWISQTSHGKTLRMMMWSCDFTREIFSVTRGAAHSLTHNKTKKIYSLLISGTLYSAPLTSKYPSEKKIVHFQNRAVETWRGPITCRIFVARIGWRVAHSIKTTLLMTINSTLL